MVDCHDVIYNILERLDNFKDLFNASHVSSLWRKIAKNLMPNLTNNYIIDIHFKITKIRFLLERIIHYDLDTYNYPEYDIEILSKDKKTSLKHRIYPIKSDDKYIVYESKDNLSNIGKLKVLTWKICHLIRDDSYFEPVIYNTQIVPDDLSWQYFETGNKYCQDDEQVVIGSAGGFYTIHCCCAIVLLP